MSCPQVANHSFQTSRTAARMQQVEAAPQAGFLKPPAARKPGAHLLRHHMSTEVGLAAAEYFGACGDRETAGVTILQLRQPKLRQTFQAVFGVHTSSGNNDWMRGKLLQSIGLSARWRPTPAEAGGEGPADSQQQQQGQQQEQQQGQQQEQQQGQQQPAGSPNVSPAISGRRHSQRARRPSKLLKPDSADSSNGAPCTGGAQKRKAGSAAAAAGSSAAKKSRQSSDAPGSPSSGPEDSPASYIGPAGRQPPMVVVVLSGDSQTVTTLPAGTSPATTAAAAAALTSPFARADSAPWPLSPGQLSRAHSQHLQELSRQHSQQLQELTRQHSQQKQQLQARAQAQAQAQAQAHGSFSSAGGQPTDAASRRAMLAAFHAVGCLPAQAQPHAMCLQRPLLAGTLQQQRQRLEQVPPASWHAAAGQQSYGRPAVDGLQLPRTGSLSQQLSSGGSSAAAAQMAATAAQARAQHAQQWAPHLHAQAQQQPFAFWSGAPDPAPAPAAPAGAAPWEPFPSSFGAPSYGTLPAGPPAHRLSRAGTAPSMLPTPQPEPALPHMTSPFAAVQWASAPTTAPVSPRGRPVLQLARLRSVQPTLPAAAASAPELTSAGSGAMPSPFAEQAAVPLPAQAERPPSAEPPTADLSLLALADLRDGELPSLYGGPPTPSEDLFSLFQAWQEGATASLNLD